MDFSKDITFGGKKNDAAKEAEVLPTDAQTIVYPSAVADMVAGGAGAAGAGSGAGATVAGGGAGAGVRSTGSASKSKKDAYPTKTSINLIQKQPKLFSTGTELLLFVLLVALIGLFAKFAVIDPLSHASEGSQEVAQLQAQLDDLRAANDGREAISEEYSKYVIEGLTEEEQAIMNREEIIDLLRSKVMNFGYMSSLKVVGNTVTVTCIGVSLNDVSALVAQLEQDPRVSYVTVSTAQGADTKGTSATISITVKSADELVSQGEASAESASNQSAAEASSEDSAIVPAEDGSAEDAAAAAGNTATANAASQAVVAKGPDAADASAEEEGAVDGQ